MNASEATNPGAEQSTPDLGPGSALAPPAPRRRAAAAAGSWALVGAIALASAALGWTTGRAHAEHVARTEAVSRAGLVLVEASFDGAGLPAADGPFPDAGGPSGPADAPPPAELVGRLKADLLALRALYRRLAEVAELDGGEFDLEFESDAVTGDGEPLSALDPADPAAPRLLIERIDPMLERSSAMARIFADRRREYDARVSGRPLAGGAVSSGFGHRTDPMTGRRVAHRGLDYTGAVGEPIHALADGVVTYAGVNGGYGKLVEIEHADGFRTRYAHNDSVLVGLGERVDKGERIATLGNSGRSTGPHLHLEVRRDGVATDPRFFVR